VIVAKVFKVAGGSRQPVEPRHGQHVAGAELVEPSSAVLGAVSSKPSPPRATSAQNDRAAASLLKNVA
jgi:hypothetical protein